MSAHLITSIDVITESIELVVEFAEFREYFTSCNVICVLFSSSHCISLVITEMALIALGYEWEQYKKVSPESRLIHAFPNLVLQFGLGHSVIHIHALIKYVNIFIISISDGSINSLYCFIFVYFLLFWNFPFSILFSGMGVKKIHQGILFFRMQWSSPL